MFCHPMKTGTYTRSSGFGPRWGTIHRGVDYAAPIGTPIYAAADGVVVQGKDRAQGSVSGFGSWIWIDAQHSCGKDFIYGHVHHPGILVKRGDRVRAGQLIGVVGNEGQSTGPHLHFEVWTSPGRTGGTAIDPEAWLTRAKAVEPGNVSMPAQPTPSGPLQLDGKLVWRPDITLLSPNISGRRDLSKIIWIIIHTDESAYDYAAKRIREVGWTAKRLAEYQQSPSAGGSYTGAIGHEADDARIAEDGSTTWSTGNLGNSLGLNFCLAGTTAHFTRAQWLERMVQLRAAAFVVAVKCQERGIPVRKLQPGDMRARRKGIGGHDDARELGGTTHWDPGPGFPWDVFLDLVKKAGSTSMDESKLRQIVREEIDIYVKQARVVPSLVSGSEKTMTIVEALAFIDYHSHESHRLARLEQATETEEATK